MAMENNSNEKTNGLIHIKKMTNKYVTHKQTTPTELQAPDMGHAHTYIMWRV